jgi:hypothetical protein
MYSFLHLYSKLAKKLINPKNLFAKISIWVSKNSKLYAVLKFADVGYKCPKTAKTTKKCAKIKIRMALRL